MSGKRSTDALKIEAIKQVTERGFTVGEVARRLPSAASPGQAPDGAARHPKKSRGVLRKGEKAKDGFMGDHAREFRLCAMCRVLGVPGQRPGRRGA